MSFVTAIRDYVEALNAISESLGKNLTVTSFLSETLLYVLKTLQSGLLYIVSLQWIRDFTLLPIVLPQISSAIFKETFFLETPSKVFFEFLEITDLNRIYLEQKKLTVIQFPRGTVWLDAGTPGSLYQSSAYVQTIQERQGIKIGCIEEDCYKKKFINKQQLTNIVDKMPKSEYKQYLEKLL